MKIRSIVWGLAFLVTTCASAKADLVYSNLNSSQNVFYGSGTYWDDATIVGGGVLSEFRYEAYNAQALAHAR